MNLHSDIARCNGASDTDDVTGEIHWREGCEDCLRRTAPRHGVGPMIEPPPIIAFECDYRIAPEEACR